MIARAGLVLALFGLVGCAAPDARCGKTAAAALDARIAQLERDIARGYRVEPAQDPETVLRLCNWPKEPVLFCTDSVRPAQSARRVAISPEQGARELVELQAQRAQCAPRA
jgi:hypothetical protein